MPNTRISVDELRQLLHDVETVMQAVDIEQTKIDQVIRLLVFGSTTPPDEAKHVGLPKPAELDCCCRYGTAQGKGEFPELVCGVCPTHGQFSNRAKYRCQHHLNP